MNDLACETCGGLVFRLEERPPHVVIICTMCGQEHGVEQRDFRWHWRDWRHRKTTVLPPGSKGRKEDLPGKTE